MKHLTGNDALKNAIGDYAFIVACDTWVGRVEAHTRLKNCLWYQTELDIWGDFRPFEDERIRKVPGYFECVDIIWNAIDERMSEEIELFETM